MPSKHTRNVVLTDHHTGFVDGLVKSGRYQNASEVLRDGLRVLEDRMRREDAELAALQERIGRSLDQLDRGEIAEGSVEEVFERAWQRAKERQGM